MPKRTQPDLPTMNELNAHIATLSAADKLTLHNKIVQSLVDKVNAEWPGIEKTPGIVGGDARIVRSRIPVWVLENYRRLGLSDEEILKNYPTLQLWDLQNAWLYVSANQAEIDRSIRENEAA